MSAVLLSSPGSGDIRGDLLRHLFSIQHFSEPASELIARPLDKCFGLSDVQLGQIANINNSRLVYHFLTNSRLKGRQYTPEDSKGFAAWANEGWRNLSYFTYLLTTQLQQVVGAIDIKSNQPTFAEIGYWMDPKFPGFMTNAVGALIAQARIAGFQSFEAYTREDNPKSLDVVRRAGFTQMGLVNYHGDPGLVRMRNLLEI